MSNVFKKYLKPAFFGSVTLIALITWFIAGSSNTPPITGQMKDFKISNRLMLAPRIPFHDAYGNKKVLADFEGNVLLINFWATWCAPCIREIPSIARLHTKKDGQNFKVLPISTDAKGADAPLKFLEKINQTNLPIYVDTKMMLARAMGVITLPTSILVDRHGNIIGRLVGTAEWDSAEALALINHYQKK
tara:strand:+ start:762 stop:1331 length:570 start_codon:yes stop_codon:yes gene_type:complete